METTTQPLMKLGQAKDCTCSSARGWQSSRPRQQGLRSEQQVRNRAMNSKKKARQTDNRKERERERERGRERVIREMGGCCSLGVKYCYSCVGKGTPFANRKTFPKTHSAN